VLARDIRSFAFVVDVPGPMPPDLPVMRGELSLRRPHDASTAGRARVDQILFSMFDHDKDDQ
jgi:hypothetical protein